MLPESFFSQFKLRWFLYFFIILFWSLWLVNQQVLSHKRLIVDDCLRDIPDYPVVIVLGAGVDSNSQPGPLFRDRLQAASILYKTNKASKILVSGYSSRYGYNELNPARNYLLNQEIEPENIFLDYQGSNTFASFYRAKNLFGIDQALIVTQSFHLPRALYLANKLGIEALGCIADNQQYDINQSTKQREILARVKAWLDINLGVSLNLAEPPVDLSASGQKTWHDN